MFQLPSNIYPELNFPRIVVLARGGDLAPDTMLLTVTRPIEESISTTPGVRRVDSKTIRGNAEISVLFQPDTDMQYSLQLVQARVSEARASLPPDAEIDVERVSPAVFPVLSLILNGNVPDADLRDDAYYVLRPLFSRVSGVGHHNGARNGRSRNFRDRRSTENARAPVVAGGYGERAACDE